MFLIDLPRFDENVSSNKRLTGTLSESRRRILKKQYEEKKKKTGK